MASAAVGNTGRVLAVEAEPQSFARLGQHLRLNNVTNVQSYNYGVSDRNECLPLYRWAGTKPNAGANTFLPMHISVDEWVKMCDVQCVTLLDVLVLGGVERVTGLKLDIEGAEYRALSRFLADAPVSLLPNFILLEKYEAKIGLAGGSAVRLLESSQYYRRLSGVNAMKRDYIFEPRAA